MIVLKCAYSSGSVAFRAEPIEGLPTPERRYIIANGEVTLDGYSEAVLAHDAEELLAMPDSLYRLPTPKEQNQAAKAKQEAATVEEDAPSVDAKSKKSAG